MPPFIVSTIPLIPGTVHQGVTIGSCNLDSKIAQKGVSGTSCGSNSRYAATDSDGT